MFPPALFTPLSVACAPQVPPGTLAAMAVTESGFDPLAIRDNTADVVWRLRDRRKALSLVDDLMVPGTDLTSACCRSIRPISRDCR